MIAVEGCAGRIRREWLELVAGEIGVLPAELVGKLRLLESTVPILSRLLGLRGVRTVADLLPDDDEEAARMLLVVHAFSGRLLGLDVDLDQLLDGADSSD